MNDLKQLFFGLTLLFLQATVGFSQSQPNQRICLGYDSYLNPNMSLKSGTLQYVLFPEDRWSLHYSLGFGATNNDKFYAHYPMGAFWGIYLLAFSDGGADELLTTLAVISFIIPEGVSYNININEKMKVSPYVNFNSMEFYYDKQDNEKIKPSFGLGSRVSYAFNPNFGVSFGLGAKIIAAEGWGIQTGVSLYYQY
jgi:hypothetical protein